MQKVLLIIAFLSIVAITHSQKIRVVENSALAKIVAKIKGEELYAITFGKTIFVSCKKEDFFANQWWVKHELAHVAQYERHGTLRFLALYTYYAVFRRKKVNPFEIEAEVAEKSSESSMVQVSPTSTSTNPKK